MDDKNIQLADYTVIISGLFVISLIILQSYLTLKPGQLDWLQNASLICFSFALPGLGAWFLAIFMNKKGILKNYKESIAMYIFLIFRIFSIVSAIVGIGLAIWNLLPLAGFTFIVFSLSNIIAIYFLRHKR